MPSIGFGTWQLAEGRQAQAATAEALKTGYRLIDTAKIYGNERAVGRAISESGIPRREIFVTTKLWTSDQGYDSTLRAFDDSLRRLGLEWLDLYLIHWPGPDSRLRIESWKALSELYAQGRLAAVGVSNYEPRHLQEILANSSLVPAVNQIEFHPFVYQRQRPTLEFCQSRGIAVEAYNPLARGRQLNDLVLQKLAQRLGKSVAQVMIRWAVGHGTIPIPKSANPQRIRENFEVFDFKLSPPDMDSLNKLSSDL